VTSSNNHQAGSIDMSSHFTSRRSLRLCAVATACATAAALPAAAQAFNPQPDPPAVLRLVRDAGLIVGFNPQPDPPGLVRRIISSVLPPGPRLTRSTTPIAR